MAVIMVISAVVIVPPRLAVQANPALDITSSFECQNFLAAVRTVTSRPAGPIRLSDVSGLTTLDLRNRNIVSLAGIEHFGALRDLNVGNNRLFTMDLSANTNLTRVEVRDNFLLPAARLRLQGLNIENLTGVELQNTFTTSIINVNALPRGIVNVPYTGTIRAVEGWPLLFSVASPAGWDFNEDTNVITGTPVAANVANGIPLTVTVSVEHPWSTTATPVIEVVTTQALRIDVTGTFMPVTDLTVSPLFGQVASPLQAATPLLVQPVIFPATATERRIEWEVIGGSAREGAIISPSVSYGSQQIAITAAREGTVIVRATMPNAAGTVANRTNFVRDFTFTFSASQIVATQEGLESLYVGSPVRAYVIYRLYSNVFVRDITASDFIITGLPPGLTQGPAERISDTEIRVPIRGTPTHIVSAFNLGVPASIPFRNINRGTIPVAVVAEGLTNLGPIFHSARITPSTATFDINPSGFEHRNITVVMQTLEDDQDFAGIRFGRYILRENIDFSFRGTGNDAFEIYSSFMERMPVGDWEIEFLTRRGNNPILQLRIVNSALPYVPDGFIPEPIGPPPAPPVAQPHPDNTFFHLSGGSSVGIHSMYWDLNRARVNPVVQGNTATVTVRADVLDDLSWRLPGSHFEIITPFTRVNVPTDLMDTIRGGRAALVNNGIGVSQTDVRFTITNRSNTPELTNQFNNTFPLGEILSPLVDLQIELINANTGAVVFTVQEFTQPLGLMFVVMPRSGHLRPSAVYFNQRAGRVEFAPHSSVIPNEITVRSTFTGIHGIVHNGTHFDDVAVSHWGFPQTFTASYSGLVIATGELSPNSVMTRGEFVQLLVNALQPPRYGVPVSGYFDVDAYSPFFDAVNRARDAGYLLHFGGNTFNPNAAITREEMVATIGVVLEHKTPNVSSFHRPLVAAFTDYPFITHWYVVDIQRAMNFGLLEGFPDHTFRPHDNATRIEALAIVVNLAQALGLM